MKQLLKRLFSDSAAFSIATMGNKLVALAFFPIYTRLLGPKPFADWDLTNTITLILSYICILGTDAAMAFYYYDAKTEEDRKLYFTNALMFSAGICLLFTILSFLFGPSLSEVMYNNPKNYEYLLPVAFLATVGAIIIQHTLAYARYSRRVWLFNIFSMSFVIGSSALSVFFLTYYHLGVMGIFYGQLIGQMTIALVLIWIFRKEFILRISKPHLAELLKYGAPLLISLLSFWLITSVSKPFIYYLVSDTEAGIFGSSIRFASFIVLITAPFQLAWRPFSMSIKERNDAPEVFGLVGRGLLVFGTLAIMVLTFIIEPLYNFVVGNPKFSDGYLYVWFLSLGTLLNVLHPVFGVGLLIKKQTKFISRAFVLAGVLFLIGNYVFVPRFGIWGSVSMTVFVYLLAVILIYRQNQKVYPIQFKFGAIMIYLIVYIASMAFISYVQANHLPNPWGYYASAFVINIVVIFASGLIPLQLLYRIGNVLPKLGGKK